jgi:hypothetical protein
VSDSGGAFARHYRLVDTADGAGREFGGDLEIERGEGLGRTLRHDPAVPQTAQRGFPSIKYAMQPSGPPKKMMNAHTSRCR